MCPVVQVEVEHIDHIGSDGCTVSVTMLPKKNDILMSRGVSCIVLSVTLGLGRDKGRLETTRGEGSLKDVFKGKGCWGLPQWLLVTIGYVGGFTVNTRSAHLEVVQRLLEVRRPGEN